MLGESTKDVRGFEGIPWLRAGLLEGFRVIGMST